MYVLFDPSRPHIVLDSGDTVDAIASSLCSRRERDLTVCVNQDGLTRALDDREQHELDERVSQLKLAAEQTPHPARQ